MVSDVSLPPLLCPHYNNLHSGEGITLRRRNYFMVASYSLADSEVI
jgi:hypothetical protein